MNGSPSSIITLGYGFSSGLVLTLGIGIGSVTSTLTGQWSNVMLLESKQPRLELYGTDRWVTLGGTQAKVEIQLP